MASAPGTLSTALTGTNNDIDYTARFPGHASAYLKIKYTDPGTETAAESVDVSYDADTGITTIDVTLRSVSSVLSTGDQVKAALDANEDVQRLVTYADTAANDGSGSVTAMAATALSAGTPDAGTAGYADADEMEDDGWDPTNDGTQYYATIHCDGRAITVGADDSTSVLKASWTWKDKFLAKASPLRLIGSGTVD